MLSDTLGSVQELGDHHVFMGWGQSGFFTEFDRAGAVVFDGRLAPGTSFSRAFKQRWSGQPGTELPAITVVSGTVATVYASYNGCTDVASWVVLGGPSPADLTGLAEPPAWVRDRITVPAPCLPSR